MKADKRVEVTRTYLQMLSPDELNGSRLEDSRIRIEPAVDCPPSFFRYLYREVGRYYHWTDRLEWTDEQILAYLGRPEIALWVMYVEGSPAGYFEHERHQDGSTEIAYFGLLPESLGRGL